MEIQLQKYSLRRKQNKNLENMQLNQESQQFIFEVGSNEVAKRRAKKLLENIDEHF